MLRSLCAALIRRLTLPKPVCYDCGIMAQPPPHAPVPAPNAPRSLPRRQGTRPAPRQNRPRFQALDAFWIAALCLLSVAVSARLGATAGHRLGPSLLAAATVGTVYALGWRARDRAAGVAAALLLALSPAFLDAASYSPQSAAFTLLCVGALLAFVAGSSLAALALASGAAMARPDGLLLGGLLLGLALAQKRPRAAWGALVFALPLAGFEYARHRLGYGLPGLPHFGASWELWRRLGGPAPLLLAWLLIPFAGEFGEAARRARWLPAALWTGLSLGAASFCTLTTAEGMALPAAALLALLAGGGVSRLLPTLAGEFPQPAVRYALAVLAVLGIAGLHLRLDPHADRLVSRSAGSALGSR